MNYEDKLDKCPNCGFDEIYRDSVDVGVGIIYGPYGCDACGWSQDSEYDRSTGQSEFYEDGGMIDQWGSYFPPGNLVAIVCYSRYIEWCKAKGLQPVFRKKNLTKDLT